MSSDINRNTPNHYNYINTDNLEPINAPPQGNIITVTSEDNITAAIQASNLIEGFVLELPLDLLGIQQLSSTD